MTHGDNIDGGQTDSAQVISGSAARQFSLLRLLRNVIIVFAALVFALTAGFVFFASHVAGMRAEADPPPSDAIVVLTGGRHRLETGLELLKARKGKRLLISGVHPDTRKSDIRRATGGHSDLISCCVDLDRTALDTVGNATESAKWLSDNGFSNVLLVTNNYHMPRSLLEARRAFSSIDVRPYPVVASDLDNGNWLTEPEALRVLVTEYLKYLAALSGASPRYSLGRSQ